ncbi:MAG: hypothetical protein UR50_C0004G0017 [Parcubacteria group bacterium GW2011_GWC1_34_10]|uniref:Uncharacterized protein n=1 Tax=Candidatus Zambryskibacteria bacterium RIFCSPLOWO2_01_FULL_35_19 TaxID=1802757 RepID=A0A1G2TXR4_9BACT|nr:MAG: hypothetical protein UR50_C0004G0017 [Parcubacteria group bacterium GW2011_GWC1_34_10]OHA85921.1 MAG: hypothetical protein A2726_02580 [Candidatus Zambryskibacteria bacterium RIFCSPHIGHO2_01_FULL_35_32]OHB02095.1 MAG: hypothetical protein A3A90_02440 [Candidatus Zambryskibacteria bacterium RIFCSPLOWO2_01_FULL_35_19]
MKLTILKFFKKDKLPPLDSLRPRSFRFEHFWFISLWLWFVVFIIMAVVSVKLFCSQYFEDYKQSRTEESLENIINVAKLKNTTEKRNDFINEDISLPNDPSF